MKRILILDDDPDLLEVLKEVLETNGYETRTKSSSSDLFEVIEEFKPDLILLDFLLMNENGGEICAELKQNINTKHLPIVLLSGYCSIQEMHVIYGCDGYLAKPFDLEKLLKIIQNLINRNTILGRIA
ncbi:MAG: hypothetical protein JWQ25_2691 [Daejeonella sp.]|nr:hypothetical protein [Daejeonella sp.]